MQGEGERPEQPASLQCSQSGAERGCRLLGRVMSAQPLGSLVRLTVSVPGWPGARPGQFAMLQAEPSRCFLARPLSVCAQAGETVAFLVAPVGDGTRELCGLAEGAPLWVVGPLGNGFDVQALATSGRRVVVVAGGVGAAPFPLLLSCLADEYGISRAGRTEESGCSSAPAEVLVLLGFRNAEQSLGASAVTGVASRLAAEGVNCDVETAVEDGSRGPSERVTDLLSRCLRPGDQVVACGPWAMCEAVWRLCAPVKGVDLWLSLETVMACGVGSCHGCVITLADGSHARVCHEGPVFTGKEVFSG
jgi:dihydroorotate dehydrogenase electron transfer subunit